MGGVHGKVRHGGGGVGNGGDGAGGAGLRGGVAATTVRAAARQRSSGAGGRRSGRRRLRLGVPGGARARLLKGGKAAACRRGHALGRRVRGRHGRRRWRGRLPLRGKAVARAVGPIKYLELSEHFLGLKCNFKKCIFF